MTSKTRTLESASEPRVILRGAEERDIEELRVWKNANKRWFFFKGDITPDMQRIWFAEYSQRPGDVLYIVEHEGRKVGAMGARALKDGAVDVYNVVAAPGESGKGLMKAALGVLCAHYAKSAPSVGCLVLKGNPAAKFYESCGFRKTGGDDVHDAYTYGGAA